MKNSAVIFDTNAYRNLVSNKSLDESIYVINEIIELESKLNITTYLSSIVSLELLGNLIEDADSRKFQECKNSIYIANIHCNNASGNLKIFPEAKLNLLKTFFNGPSQRLIDLTTNLIGVTQDIFRNVKNIDIHLMRATFSDIKNFLDNKEKEFSSIIQNSIKIKTQEIRKQNPSISKAATEKKLIEYYGNVDTSLNFAKDIINYLSAEKGITISEKKQTELALACKDFFPIAVGFLPFICKIIVENKIDMNSKKSKHKRWNWIWDYNLAFGLSSTIKEKNILLITSDADLTAIVDHFGFSDRILTIEQYQKRLICSSIEEKL